MNTLFKYRETVCSNKEKQSVFIWWNEMFFQVKQSVRHNETTCSIKGNTLFAIGKRSFISRAYKEKALQINDSQSLIEYSKRDLNPHSRNGQRILSPSCLPFHHSSILKREKRAENETRTRDPNLGKVALSSPQNATRLGVTNWAISFYDDFLECVLPRFSHWLNGWLNICVCLLVCKWLLIRELFNGLNKFCNTFFLVIHWHSEFIVFK